MNTKGFYQTMSTTIDDAPERTDNGFTREDVHRIMSENIAQEHEATFSAGDIEKVADRIVGTNFWYKILGQLSVVDANHALEDELVSLCKELGLIQEIK